MKKVARMRINQDEFVPPNKASVDSNVGVRTTGRIKKPKAVFDPSDNYVPRAQRANQVVTVTSPKIVTSSPPAAAAAGREKQRERSLSTGSNASNNSSTQDTDICKVCLKREPRRGGNYKNKLLTCVNCSQKVHRWCASTDFLESAPVRQNFKCATCRTCYTCENNKSHSKASGDLVTCAKCLASYHVACHTPKVTKQQQSLRNWKCCKCAPNATSPVASDSSTSKEESLPVTVIRQIIGYDANIQPLPAKRASPKPEQSAKEPQQKPNQSPKEEQQKSPECNDLLEEPAKARSKALSRTHSEISESSSSSESESSDDEDYKYVEKKKRRLLSETNNNNNNNNGSTIEKSNGKEHANGNEDDINMEDHIVSAESESEQKPISNIFTNAIDDLPKREVVRTWSVEKLSNYVKKYFPNEAQVFKEHEIDGNALLLLKRSDVVKKLPLKLGPSLRLYNFILKIQTQKPNDPTLGWDCSIDTSLPSTE